MRNIPLRKNTNKSSNLSLFSDTAQETNDRNEEIMNAVRSGGLVPSPRPIITDPNFDAEDPDSEQLAKAISSIVMAGQRFVGLVNNTTVILNRVGNSPVQTPNALVVGMEVIFVVTWTPEQLPKWTHIQVGSIPPTPVYSDANKTPIPPDFSLAQQVVRCIYNGSFFIAYSKAHRVLLAAKHVLYPVGDIQLKPHKDTKGWIPLDGRTIPYSDPAYKRLTSACTQEYFKRWGFVVNNVGITLPNLEAGSIFNTYEIAKGYKNVRQNASFMHSHVGGHMVSDGSDWGYFGVTDREESDFTISGKTEEATKNWQFGFLDLPDNFTTVAGRWDGTDATTITTATKEGGGIEVNSQADEAFKVSFSQNPTSIPPHPSSYQHWTYDSFVVTPDVTGTISRTFPKGSVSLQEEVNIVKDKADGVKTILSSEVYRSPLQDKAEAFVKAQATSFMHLIINNARANPNLWSESRLNLYFLDNGVPTIYANKEVGETYNAWLLRVESGLIRKVFIPTGGKANTVSFYVTYPSSTIQPVSITFTQLGTYYTRVKNGEDPSVVLSSLTGISIPTGSSFIIPKGDVYTFDSSKDYTGYLHTFLNFTRSNQGKAMGLSEATLNSLASFLLKGVFPASEMSTPTAYASVISMLSVGRHLLLQQSTKGRDLINQEKVAVASGNYASLIGIYENQCVEIARGGTFGDIVINKGNAVEKQIIKLTVDKIVDAYKGAESIGGAIKASWEALKTSIQDLVKKHEYSGKTSSPGTVSTGIAVQRAIGAFWEQIKNIFTTQETKDLEFLGSASDHHTSSTGTGGDNHGGGDTGSSHQGASMAGAWNAVVHDVNNAVHGIGDD